MVPPDALGPQPALGHPFLAEPTAAWSCRAAWVSPAGRHWKPPLPGARSGRSGARAGGGFPPGRRAVFRWSLRSAPTCDDARIWASRPATSSSRSLRGEVTSSCRGCTFLSSSTLTSAAASTSLRSAPVAASVTLRSHASLSRGTSSSRCPSLLGTQHLEGGARLTDPAARSPGWAREPGSPPGFPGSAAAGSAPSRRSGPSGPSAPAAAPRCRPTACRRRPSAGAVEQGRGLAEAQAAVRGAEHAQR